MTRIRSVLFPALAQALVLLGLAAGLAVLVNASHPGRLPWGAAPLPAPAAAAPAEAAAGPAVLDLAQARVLHESGVPFLDARLAADYSAGHIPGARSVPPEMFSDQVEALLADGSKDRPLVVYCHDPACPLARELAENLLLLGYTGVQVFAGGMAAWAGAGLPVDAGVAL